MLNSNLYTSIFVYLDIWELLEHIALVSKYFQTLCNLTLRHKQYAKIHIKNLNISSNYLPNLTHLKLIIDDERYLTVHFTTLNNFTNLKILNLEYKEFINLESILDCISFNIFCQLEKLIVHEKELIRSSLLGKKLLNTKTIKYDQSEIPDIETLTKYAEFYNKGKIKVNLGFKISFPLFSMIFKNTLLDYLDLIKSLKTINFRVDDYLKNIELVSLLPDAKKLVFGPLMRLALDNICNLETSTEIRKLVIPLNKNNPDYNTKMLLKYIKTKPKLEDLEVDCIYEEWGNYLGFVEEVLEYVVANKHIKWVNGIPIQEVVCGRKIGLELRISKYIQKSMVTCCLYKIFYEEILRVCVVRVLKTKKTKKFYSKKGLGESLEKREAERLPIFGYLLREDCGDLQRYALFSLLGALVCEYFQVDFDEQRNCREYEEVLRIRNKLLLP